MVLKFDIFKLVEVMQVTHMEVSIEEEDSTVK